MSIATRTELGAPTPADRAWHAHLAERFPDRRRDRIERAARQRRAEMEAQGVTRPTNDCVARAGGMAAFIAAGGCGTARCATCHKNSPAVRAEYRRAAIN